MNEKIVRRGFFQRIGSSAVAGKMGGSLLAEEKVKRGQNRFPNILYILCDDLGIGDLSSFHAGRGKIHTPHIDGLAQEGMRFTDAHSASAVCTPTRYGILTGRYPWRSSMKQGVGGGFSPRLIENGRLTVPSLLQHHGYRTACIGKWHLGMDWPLQGGGIARDYPDGWKVDYRKRIQNGPNALGFDYYFGISASLDMPPYVFIENDRVTEIPTLEKAWSVGPLRKGPTAAGFDAVEVLPQLTRKAVDFISRQTRKEKKEPFFLYLPFAAPHTPVIPTPDLRGKHELGWYGDFVTQVDRSVGEVLATLDRSGAAENTLVLLASDNGFAPIVGYIDSIEDQTVAGGVKELEARGHFPSAGLRGYKTDAWEGGHRIPLIARWPGKVRAGTTCAATVCLNDLMATAAEIVGRQLPDNAGEDSFSMLPALLGTVSGPLREATVHATGRGILAIRQEEWKLILGGSADDGNRFELYHLGEDPAEKNNLAAARPEVVARLQRLMEKYVRQGRSTPGAPQKNTDPQEWPQLWWMRNTGLEDQKQG